MRGYELTALLFCTSLPFAAGPCPRQRSRTGAAAEGDRRRFRTERYLWQIVPAQFAARQGGADLLWLCSCPDECPTDLLQLRDILALLGERRDRVQPAFISVDPGRDTPERSAAYVAVFSSAILALTGSEARLRRVAKSPTARTIGRTTGSTTYTVDHPANPCVVDPVGKLARILPYGTPMADVIKANAPMIE